MAWVVASDGIAIEDWNRAVAFTPGGGRLGGIDGSQVDDKLSEHAGLGSSARLVTVEISEVEALISELPGPGTLRAVVAPAEALPDRVWSLALERIPFCLTGNVENGEVTSIQVYAEADDDLPEDAAAAMSRAGATLDGDTLISSFRAAPRLVVVGASPIADALRELGGLLDWQASTYSGASEASGVIATLTEMDMVVVAAHDLELAGVALLAAIDSRAGYIGSVGSQRMQENRADWLAYRGATELDRISGPAGIDIGASTPAEIAVSIAAEAIAATRPVERSAGRG